MAGADEFGGAAAFGADGERDTLVPLASRAGPVDRGEMTEAVQADGRPRDDGILFQLLTVRPAAI